MTPHDLMIAIAAEASRLEARLQLAVQADAFPEDALKVLYCAALEVAELENVLATGHADHILWVVVAP